MNYVQWVCLLLRLGRGMCMLGCGHTWVLAAVALPCRLRTDPMIASWASIEQYRVHTSIWELVNWCNFSTCIVGRWTRALVVETLPLLKWAVQTRWYRGRTAVHLMQLGPDRHVCSYCERLPYTTLSGAYTSCISGFPSWSKSIVIAVTRSNEYRLFTALSRSKHEVDAE